MTEVADILIRKGFILEAHNEACSEWKRKIEEEFPELFSIEESVKKLESYETLRRTITSPLVHFKGTSVIIDLPNANRDWTFAAWDLARDICDEFGYYPKHNDVMSNAMNIVLIKG